MTARVLSQPLSVIAGARTIPLPVAAALCGCSTRTLRRAADAGQLDVIRVNRRVIRVALVDLSAWYLKNDRSLSATTRKRIGRPWGSANLHGHEHD